MATTEAAVQTPFMEKASLDQASQASSSDTGYIILRHSDVLDPECVVFENQKRGDTLRIKYRHNGKAKILYLQSGPAYARTPLIVDGQLQSTFDLDLCELSNLKSAEFVKKLRLIEGRMVQHMAKAGGDDTDVYNHNTLLKSSLRVLTKLPRKRMPAFRISTNSFDQKAIFGKVGDVSEDMYVAEDARVSFIVEVFGLKTTRKNGLAIGLWRLSQLKIMEDKNMDVSNADHLGLEDAFADDEE